MSASRSQTWCAIPARFISFDGSTTASSRYFAPDRYRFWDDYPAPDAAISRGAGLSYAAASFSASAPSVDHRRFNRLLDFDSSQNILEVETGVTLGQVYEFATPRGLYLPVQPGHPRITVGGCIGADAHGKNQFRDGTFLSQIESLRLFHPAHGVVELSLCKEPDLFRLTCGGYGLTGNILTVRLRLGKIPSPEIRTRIIPVADVFRLNEELARAAEECDLVYSWHDFTARGGAFGRGFLVAGSFTPGAPGEGMAAPCAPTASGGLSAAARGRARVCFFNRLTTPPFNRLYLASVRAGAQERVTSFYDFAFPVHNKELYFYLFGNAGFHECQVLMPAERFGEFVRAIQERLGRQPVAVTLASAKLFRGRRELLRFTGDGICLALNFPRNAAGLAFAAFLDDATREFGGWPNLIKDSRLSAAVVANAYPEYELFREQLRRFDPRRLFRSEMSVRLKL